MSHLRNESIGRHVAAAAPATGPAEQDGCRLDASCPKRIRQNLLDELLLRLSFNRQPRDASRPSSDEVLLPHLTRHEALAEPPSVLVRIRPAERCAPILKVENDDLLEIERVHEKR